MLANAMEFVEMIGCHTHEHAMCVLSSHGGFLGQEPWCVSGDCT